MSETPDELAEKRAARKRPPINKDGTPRQKPGTTRGRKPGSVIGPTTGQKEIVARQRQAKAIQLRVAGASLAVVAKECGYADPSGAHQAIVAGLREILPDQDRSDARRLELAKLDRLEMAAWPLALRGDDRAAATILRCVQTRAKLLGLEAPAQIDLRVREGEMVRVEILEVLNDETLAALKPLQEEMVRLSEMRANAIDVQAT